MFFSIRRGFSNKNGTIHGSPHPPGVVSPYRESCSCYCQGHSQMLFQYNFLHQYVVLLETLDGVKTETISGIKVGEVADVLIMLHD